MIAENIQTTDRVSIPVGYPCKYVLNTVIHPYAARYSRRNREISRVQRLVTEHMQVPFSVTQGRYLLAQVLALVTNRCTLVWLEETYLSSGMAGMLQSALAIPDLVITDPCYTGWSKSATNSTSNFLLAIPDGHTIPDRIRF